MKKSLLFIVVFGFAATLKAQQSTQMPLNKLLVPNKSTLFDSVPKLSYKQQNDIKSLFLPKPKLSINQNLVAALDHMPIVKPVGIWTMPVVHPNGTVVYTMPIKRLPPVVKTEKENQKTNP